MIRRSMISCKTDVAITIILTNLLDGLFGKLMMTIYYAIYNKVATFINSNN